MVNLGNDWDALLADEFQKPYYLSLRESLITEYKTRPIYPDMYHIFEALKLTAFSDTKAVILGQDPYHGRGQAHGLAFSVQKGVALPPSLQNIYRELQTDLGLPMPNHGCLEKWAKEGVLLLNASLTVREGLANSHQTLGWSQFTDRVIALLGEREKPLVFMLWGNFARAKKALIKNPNHLILEAPHPSPLSAYSGFFGCRHFSKANAFLEAKGETPIDWAIENI